MRIGINALFVLPDSNGGTETYVRGLLEGLTKNPENHSYWVFVNKIAYKSFLKHESKNIHIVCCSVLGHSRLGRILYEQVILPVICLLYRIDILHSPGFVAPLLSLCKNVITIHDLYYLHFPNWLSASKQLYWQFFIPFSMAKARGIFVPTQAIKEEITRFFPKHAKKVRVTHEANRFQPIQFKEQSPEFESTRSKTPYFFWIGTFGRHKNVTTLIYAFDQLVRDATGAPPKLILAGARGSSLDSSFDECVKLVTELGLQNVVEFVGRISDEQAISYMKQACAFIFPSLYEGFGLPVLEAMSQGCPVIASDIPALRELIGNAGLLVKNPTSFEGFAQAMLEILRNKNESQNFAKKGLERLEGFSFEKMSLETLSGYNDAKK
ncbi:MAG: glycosyltransferase family 4 protein [Bacteriovoracia bacterium]